MARNDDVERVWDLMEKISICMMATWDGSELHSRPMGAYSHRDERMIYFLTDVRRRLLGRMKSLPIAGEYMHRDMFDACRKYGKDTFMLIHYFTTDAMPRFFAIKGRLDAWFERLPFVPRNFVDKVVQFASQLWPEMLPKRMLDYRDRFEHHLMLKVARENAAEAEAPAPCPVGRSVPQAASAARAPRPVSRRN